MNNNDMKPVKPLDGDIDLNRKQVAKYMNRLGRGLNCRLDVPVLVVNDVKWAAKIFGDLSKRLTEIAFDDSRSDIWRILDARYAMEDAKRELHYRNERKESVKLSRNMRDKNY